jgi:hypothetical protein
MSPQGRPPTTVSPPAITSMGRGRPFYIRNPITQRSEQGWRSKACFHTSGGEMRRRVPEG